MMLKGTRTGVLTCAALDILLDQGGDCCQTCCGMCWVLRDMINNHDLDRVVRGAPTSMYVSSGWWDRETGTVRQSWLMTCWQEPCTHGSEEDALAVATSPGNDHDVSPGR